MQIDPSVVYDIERFIAGQAFQGVAVNIDVLQRFLQGCKRGQIAEDRMEEVARKTVRV